MFLKIFVLIVFTIILYCLGSAAFYLTKKNDSKAFAKALTWRIVLSIALFAFLFFAYWIGWITPHGVER